MPKRKRTKETKEAYLYIFGEGFKTQEEFLERIKTTYEMKGCHPDVNDPTITHIDPGVTLEDYMEMNNLVDGDEIISMIRQTVRDYKNLI